MHSNAHWIKSFESTLDELWLKCKNLRGVKWKQQEQDTKYYENYYFPSIEKGDELSLEILFSAAVVLSVK